LLLSVKQANKWLNVGLTGTGGLEGTAGVATASVFDGGVYGDAKIGKSGHLLIILPANKSTTTGIRFAPRFYAGLAW
jgi:hypothetical protein